MKIEDYNEYYIQSSDHYLIPKDVFNELFNEMVNWREESNKKKEVIDKAIEYINHFSKESEVKIYGLPKCKVFIGDIEQLLEILKELSEWIF